MSRKPVFEKIAKHEGRMSHYVDIQHLCSRHPDESRTKRPVDKKAVGQKGRRTKRPGDGKACLFDAHRTRRLDWADSSVECLLEFVM